MAMEMRILINDAGQVSVTGPIDNKLVCYGLLEVAKECIRDHHEKAKTLVQPIAVIPHFGKVNGG